jgi:hypothetical protein
MTERGREAEEVTPNPRSPDLAAAVAVAPATRADRERHGPHLHGIKDCFDK